MPQTSRTLRQKLPGWLLVLLVFSPAIFTAHLVWTKAVDVGAWDMWGDAPLLEKWHDGTLTWRDLYAPQIQHRIVVPRLLIIALAELSGGDFRWQQYTAWCFVATVSVLLWFLMRRTLGASPWRWPLMFAFNLLLFCPMHYQQLLWGSSMWTLIPVPCLLCIALVLTPRDGAGGTAWRLAVALLLAEIATHSFAHGLAVWPVLLGLLVVNPALGTMRHRLVLAGIATVVAAVTITAYFTDFINTAHHAYDLKPGDSAFGQGKSLFEVSNLHVFFRFFFAFLGTWFARSPFVDRPIDDAVLLGQITFILFMGLAAITVRNGLWKATLPWLALGFYVLIVGAMLSKRGADIGEHRAITPRYLAVSQYLLISGLAITAILGAVMRRAGERWRASHPEAATAPRSDVPRIVGIVLLTIFCTALIPVWRYGLHLTSVWHHARLQGKAILLFLPHLKDQGRLVSMETLDKKSADWDCYDDGVSKMLRIGLLRTRPLETPELKWFTKDKPLPASKADVTHASVSPDGILTLRGHARFTVGQPVNAILMVQNGRVVSLGQPAPRHVLRIYGLDYEFSNTAEVHVEDMYPWEGQAKLPTLDAPIELWALDVEQRRISQVAGTLTIDTATREVNVARDKPAKQEPSVQ